MYRLKSLAYLLLAGACLALWAGTAGATTPPPPGKPAPTLVLAITPEDYAPFFMRTPGATTKNSPRRSTLVGIMPDALNRIAARLGSRVEFRSLPRARLEAALRDGSVDTILLAREWAKQPEHFLFSDPLVDLRDVVLVVTDSPVRQLEDLRGKQIGTRIGYSYPELDAQFRAGLFFRRDADAEQAVLQMLILRRTDAAVLNEKVAEWLLQRQNQQGKVRTLHALGAVGYCFAFAPRHATLHQQFNAEIARLRSEGALQAILSTYRD